MFKSVTIAGIDHTISQEELIEISEKYPFVEWGILLSGSRRGEKRYPDFNWIRSFLDKTKDNSKVNISIHACGSYVRELKQCKFSFRNLIYNTRVNRIQINCLSEQLSKDELFNITHCIPHLEYEIILPTKTFSIVKYVIQEQVDSRISVLYDCSGGKGIELDNYCISSYGKYKLGMAGGINPNNIKQVLADITRYDTYQDEPDWIDLESGVRDENNNFVISKVVDILEEANKYLVEKEYKGN